jgi:hypothetical protein
MAGPAGIGENVSRIIELRTIHRGRFVGQEHGNRGRKAADVILNTWTTKWNGHALEVRNHCFVAELVIDGEPVDRVPGVFRHDLRGSINGSSARRRFVICCNDECAHRNRPEARFCANCGEELSGDAATHLVHAVVEAHFPPPRVNCRILVDGEEVLTEGP